MKCVTCGQEKPSTEFNWRYKSMGIRQKFCKECQHEHQKNFYLKHQKEEKERTRIKRTNAREKAREYIYLYKSENPCRICGESDPNVLEFDHIRGKGNTINRLVNDGASIERIKMEIRLCQVLCSNCHRRKTLAEIGKLR